jgi:non-specific serine/threonine protein kinase
VLRCEGDYWTLARDGRAARLKDSKGLHYLARLLAQPGREFHVLDLLAPTAPADSSAPRRVERALEILDAQAKTAYRRRIESLRAELEEAEQFNDRGRAERARAEMDAIAEQLAAAVGLGGRDRKAAAAAERARSTVTQRLRAAIKKIGEHHPALADHLANRVKTGTFCVYSPDPARPIEWEL